MSFFKCSCDACVFQNTSSACLHFNLIWWYLFVTLFYYQSNQTKKKLVSTCLVFFKGWNITLQCHLNKHWLWVEPVFYHRQFSMVTNQKDWAVDCPADDIQIQMKKTGASKGWTMIHDIRRSYNITNKYTHTQSKIEQTQQMFKLKVIQTY